MGSAPQPRSSSPARRSLPRLSLASLLLTGPCLLLAPYAAFAQQNAAQQPAPARHPAQRIPSSPDFPTGPAVGEHLPEFRLPNQHGEPIDFHVDRAGRKAALLFQRSAVW